MTLADELKAALKAAKGGETIRLKPGVYGEVTLSKYVYTDPVTLTPEDPTNPPVFLTTNISYCKGLNLDGIIFKIEAKPRDAAGALQTVSNTSALRLNTCDRVKVNGCDLSGTIAIDGVSEDMDPNAIPRPARPGDAIIGWPIGRCLTVWKCSDTSITNNKMHHAFRGVVADSCPRFVFTDNDINNLRGSPFNGSDLGGALIERNWSHSSRPWKFGANGDHGDHYHIFASRATADERNAKMIIRNNLLDQGDGQPILGIYLDDGGVKLGFTGVEITDNVIINTGGQAVRLENAIKSVVARNRMLQVGGDSKDGPSVIYRDCAEINTADNELHDVFGMIANKVAGTYVGNKVLAATPDSPAIIADARKRWLETYRTSKQIEPPVNPPVDAGLAILGGLLSQVTAVKQEVLKTKGRVTLDWKTPAQADAFRDAITAYLERSA